MQLSVILPTIRVHLLDKWFRTLEKSCNRNKFEVICAGPFPPSASLLKLPNFKWISSFASPTVCAQLCGIEARGELLLHSVDDALYYPDAVSNEIDVYNDNIVGMRYNEGENYSGKELPEWYWYCETAYRGWQAIHPRWGHCVHFMMPTSLFKKVGGFNCQYHYLNEATHDLLFRLQKNGVRYALSRQEVTNCSWQPERTGDHGSIHDAQIGHDAPLFRSLWGQGVQPLYIDINNWKSQPEVWSTRFTGTESSYNDLRAK